jgi:hypothetical protein
MLPVVSSLRKLGRPSQASVSRSADLFRVSKRAPHSRRRVACWVCVPSPWTRRPPSSGLRIRANRCPTSPASLAAASALAALKRRTRGDRQFHTCAASLVPSTSQSAKHDAVIVAVCQETIAAAGTRSAGTGATGTRSAGTEPSEKSSHWQNACVAGTNGTAVGAGWGPSGELPPAMHRWGLAGMQLCYARSICSLPALADFSVPVTQSC